MFIEINLLYLLSIFFPTETEEWNEFYGMFKSQIKLLTEAVTARYTLTTMTNLTAYVRQLIAQQQALSVTEETTAQSKAVKAIEAKSLLLDFEIFYTIYMPLFSYIVPQSGSSNGSSDGEVSPAIPIDFKAVETCMCALLTTIIAWQPNSGAEYLFVIEKYKLIQCHNSVLKLFPIEYIIQIYMIYFEPLLVDVQSIPGDQLSGFNLIKGRAGISVAQLTTVVAENIVKSSYLDSFLNQVSCVSVVCI